MGGISKLMWSNGVASINLQIHFSWSHAVQGPNPWADESTAAQYLIKKACRRNTILNSSMIPHIRNN